MPEAVIVIGNSLNCPIFRCLSLRYEASILTSQGHTRTFSITSLLILHGLIFNGKTRDLLASLAFDFRLLLEIRLFLFFIIRAEDHKLIANAFCISGPVVVDILVWILLVCRLIRSNSRRSGGPYQRGCSWSAFSLGESESGLSTACVT